MADVFDQLSPRQIKALNALMEGDTREQAAKRAGVAVETLHFWMVRKDEFRTAYEQQKRALVADVEYRAPETLARAAELLTEIFTYGEQPDENRRPDLALALLKTVFAKANNINIVTQNNDNSQSLHVSGNGAPLDAKALNPASIDAFVEALRGATLTVEAKQIGDGKDR